MSESPSSTPPVRALPRSRKWRYRLEAAGFFLVIGFFRLFGIDTASAIGGRIGRTFAAPTRLSNLARENLAAAFPDMGVEKREAIIRAMWDNLGRVLAEYGHHDELNWRRPAPRIEFTGLENLAAAKARGKGMLFISGHFANWEIMATALRDWGIMGASAVRPTNNPYVNAWLHKYRTRNGMPELVSKGAAGTRRIFTLLRKGESICMLVDQRTSEGIPAPFFGRDALTTATPAALALKLGALIVPISNERLGGAHFLVHVHPVIEAPHTGNADGDLVAVTTAINAFVEACVRKRPEQWLWIHRRWTDPNAPLRKRAQALSLARNGAASATSNRV